MSGGNSEINYHRQRYDELACVRPFLNHTENVRPPSTDNDTEENHVRSKQLPRSGNEKKKEYSCFVIVVIATENGIIEKQRKKAPPIYK